MAEVQAVAAGVRRLHRQVDEAVARDYQLPSLQELQVLASMVGRAAQGIRSARGQR